ncbi:hypothetical protein [Lentzea tibetensis]|uniref:hypothetical protein n=1 Tax=Lentzea tibetensis TaxID=2591470 RepID=UPI00164759CC|nr:hypothetical protein [Lentzea tibetensis]
MLTAELCAAGRSYVPEPKQVVEGCDCALIVGDQAVSVARRGEHRAWKYAICVLLDV